MFNPFSFTFFSSLQFICWVTWGNIGGNFVNFSALHISWNWQLDSEAWSDSGLLFLCFLSSKTLSAVLPPFSAVSYCWCSLPRPALLLGVANSDILVLSCLFQILDAYSRYFPDLLGYLVEQFIEEVRMNAWFFSFSCQFSKKWVNSLFPSENDLLMFLNDYFKLRLKHLYFNRNYSLWSSSYWIIGHWKSLEFGTWVLRHGPFSLW